VTLIALPVETQGLCFNPSNEGGVTITFDQLEARSEEKAC
jgi:hypothetical protein